MKRIYQGWLLAGMAALGQPAVNLAYGQASAQSNAPVVASTPQSVGPAKEYGGTPSTYPRGGASSYPRGYQQPPAVARPSAQGYPASPGSAASRIPYPRSAASFPHGNQFMPGITPTASPQAGPGGYGAFAIPGAEPIGSGRPRRDGCGGLTVRGHGRWDDWSRRGSRRACDGNGRGRGARRSGRRGCAGWGNHPAGGNCFRMGEPPRGTETTTPSEATAAGTGLGTGGTAADIAGLGGDIGPGERALFTPNMIGDLSPFYSQPAVSPPGPNGQHGAALLYPTVRNFKASENQSPRPQDRVFFDFNYYSNVNSAINTADRTPVDHMRAYTYLWGFEKTFDNGNGSIGLRLPLNSLTANSPNNAISTPTSTALGNLDIFAKYILKQNTETGSLITAGSGSRRRPPPAVSPVPLTSPPSILPTSSRSSPTCGNATGSTSKDSADSIFRRITRT